MNRSHRNSILLIIFFIVVFGARLVHLEADFPHELTWSGLLYTDEGWYARNATADVLSGDWHIPGDFNPAVNTPLFFAIQSLSFRLFGLGLFSARLTVVLFSILLSGLVYHMLSTHAGRRAGVIALAILATNYTWFAFNRLAILEMPMIFFVTAALAFLIHPAERYRLLFAGLSALCFALAMLIKTSAIFALPVLLAAILLMEGNLLGKRMVALGIFLSILGAAGILYWIFVVVPYREDFRFFIDLNITSRVQFTLKRMIDSLIKSLYFGKYLGKILYPIGMIYAFFYFILDRKFRQNRLVQLSVLWTVILLLMIAFNHYFPPRYYLPLMIPLTVFLAIIADDLLKKGEKNIYSMVFGVLVLLSVSIGGVNVIRYLSFPSYSFIEMAQDIHAQIEERGHSRNVLLGYQANQIGLTTGIESINDKHGTQSLDWRIQRYHPNFYVRWKTFDDYFPILEKYYEVKSLKTYDVFSNYYEGNPLQFYELVSRNTESERVEEEVIGQPGSR